MREWKLAVFGIVCATVGWWVGAYPPGGLDGTMARHRVHRKQMLQMCFMNMQHQFTPGYKGYVTAFDYDETPRSLLNMAQGEIFRVQTPTNLALTGPGFFVLEGGRYTRDGRFEWKDGCLRNQAGRAVLGAKGPLKPSLKPVHRFDDLGQLFGESSVTDPVTGQVVTSTELADRVQIVRFAKPELLARRDVTEFVATADSGPPEECRDTQVCPASLELSNVDFMVEGASIGRIKGTNDMLLPPPATPRFNSSFTMQPTGLLGNGTTLPAGADPMALPKK